MSPQADVLITTAAVPGRRAPLLVTAEMVQGMRPGSVVVDLAAESGGNVEGVVPGEDILVPTADGQGHVTLVGLKDAPSAMASDASRLYAKNVANLLALMTRDGTVAPDFDDDVIAGACLTHDGAVRHRPRPRLAAVIPALPTMRRASRTSPNGVRDSASRRVRTRGNLMDGMSLLTVTVLAVFVGFEVVSKVSSTLHTPADVRRQRHPRHHPGGRHHRGRPGRGPWVLAVALLAVVLATANLVGGFVVTDRMLHMFHGRKEPVRTGAAHGEDAQVSLLDPVWTSLLYLAAAVFFILALRGLSSPRTARRGNLIGAFGALLAVVTVFLSARLENIPWILGAIAVGTAVAAPVARRVKMTQMPQLVALFNGVGGGAAALVALLELGHNDDPWVRLAIVFTLLVGAVSFAGSGRHVRQAPGTDDHPPGGVPRPPRGDGGGAARRGGHRRRRRPHRFPARSRCC